MSIFDSFIPVPNGQMQLIMGDLLLDSNTGDTAYEVINGYVVFKTDITLLGITAVRMQLVVADVDRLTDYDVLPIPADMEDTVIRKVFELMSAQRLSDKDVDSSVDNKAPIKQ